MWMPADLTPVTLTLLVVFCSALSVVLTSTFASLG